MLKFNAAFSPIAIGTLQVPPPRLPPSLRVSVPAATVVGPL